MCLLLLAWRAHPAYPLVLAANRDEFHARPTRSVHYWETAPHVLAGRDLRAGGTWLGVSRSGRIASISNFREPLAVSSEVHSRGRLVADYLCRHRPARVYLEELQPSASQYPPFNLLLGDLQGLYYFSNRGGAPQAVTQGVHGLSNHLLDTPWPKVVRGRQGLSQVLGRPGPLDLEAIFTILADRSVPSDGELPDTGIGLDLERMLAPIFIAGTDYGTRSSTVMALDQDGRLEVVERVFGPGGLPLEDARFAFTVDARSGLENPIRVS